MSGTASLPQSLGYRQATPDTRVQTCVRHTFLQMHPRSLSPLPLLLLLLLRMRMRCHPCTVNDAPQVITPAAATITQGMSGFVDLLAGAIDEEGDPMTAEIVSSPTVGFLSSSAPDNKWLYTGTPSSFGTLSFTYVVKDNKGATSATATGTLNVRWVADDGALALVLLDLDALLNICHCVPTVFCCPAHCISPFMHPSTRSLAGLVAHSVISLIAVTCAQAGQPE